jgi:hypothetical protein
MIALWGLGRHFLSPLAGAAMALLLPFGAKAAGASTTEIRVQELDADRCFMFSALLSYKTEGNTVTELPLELVINDDAEYEKLFDPKIKRQSCADVDRAAAIPKINFSKQTVLALWASGSCAAREFRKKVWRDDSHKLITYSVAIIESETSCSGPGLESLNLIAIPKIPEGYKVSFETIRE